MVILKQNIYVTLVYIRIFKPFEKLKDDSKSLSTVHILKL